MNTSKIEHVRLLSHKGLRNQNLVDLGKINVVCGPNNSGKTTVLECLADNSKRRVGKKLSDEEIDSLVSVTIGQTGWNSIKLDKNQAYSALVRNAVRSREYWFSDEGEQCWEPVKNAWQGSIGGYTQPLIQFLEQFKACLRDAFSTVLVPAKRQLQTQQKVDPSEVVSSHGSGILNFLFHAKNQKSDAPNRLCYDRMWDAFHKISGGFEFEVFLREDSQAELQFRLSGQDWIFASDCGLGLQELLIILYYSITPSHQIVLIEEPENHLHPEMQRRLISYLRDETEKQFFLSTHSSVFLNTQFADRVFICRMESGVVVENVTSRAQCLTALGYSIADNLVSDVIILCEGPTDKPVLEEFLSKLGVWKDYNIKVWPLGGDIMDQLDLTVFTQSHKVVALVDGDPKSGRVRRRFVEKCKTFGVPVQRLSAYALENYFTVEAIGKIMKGQMPADIAAIDPKKSIREQLGFDVKKNGGRIAELMSLRDIEGTDLHKFLIRVESIAKAP